MLGAGWLTRAYFQCKDVVANACDWFSAELFFRAELSSEFMSGLERVFLA